MLTERSARVVAAVKLHRHAARKREQRFLAEGPNLIGAAIERGLVGEVFATESAAQRHDELLATARAPVNLITDRAAKALSDTVTPAGLIAVCTLPETDLHRVLADEPKLVAVAVGVGEPGNAGTLIRLSHAMGADAVVLAGHSVDPFNGKCLRASTGSIFAVPVVVEPDVAAVVRELQRAGLVVLATSLDGEVELADAELSRPTAWLFGPEAHGLPPEVTAAADHRVRIEMPGGAESLNVAAAAAICLYQSMRGHR